MHACMHALGGGQDENAAEILCTHGEPVLEEF